MLPLKLSEMVYLRWQEIHEEKWLRRSFAGWNNITMYSFV